MKETKLYICSPLRNSCNELQKQNMANAAWYERSVPAYYEKLAFDGGLEYQKCGRFIGYAPHSVFPRYMDDRVPEDRRLAMELCLLILRKCDVLVVVGGVITEGMAEEIKKAKEWGLAIWHIDPSQILSVS